MALSALLRVINQGQNPKKGDCIPAHVSLFTLASSQTTETFVFLSLSGGELQNTQADLSPKQSEVCQDCCILCSETRCWWTMHSSSTQHAACTHPPTQEQICGKWWYPTSSLLARLWNCTRAFWFLMHFSLIKNKFKKILPVVPIPPVPSLPSTEDA